ncbi:hypothetical protein ACHAPO_011538 [Fusarium lateritium]
MLRQWLVNNMQIIRKIINYDNNMMQDAMGVILFPQVISSEGGLLYDRPATVIRTHVRKWSKSQLPDLLMKNDDSLARQLCKLHRRIILLTEDYITKATAYFPPREYLCLPQMQGLPGEHLLFKGAKVTPRFDSANLTPLERKRFVKAFLMYHLMAKTSHLGQLPGGLPRRRVNQVEEEAILFVIGYMENLYGAMFAQCTDAWLPTISSVTSPEDGLLYPDNLGFDTEVYGENVFTGSNRYWYRHTYGKEFERLGPGRLFDFFRYDLSKSEERDNLKLELQKAIAWNHNHWHGWKETLNIFLDPGKFYKDDCESFMYEHLSVELSISSGMGGRSWKICGQRAWVFFDDDRFYPQGTTERPTFPSHAFLAEQDRLVSLKYRGQLYRWDKKRALRRSQKWHDGIIVCTD